MADSGRANNYNQCTSQDEDMGPKHCSTDGIATYGGHYSVLISNLEKDISPSAIKNFIYKQTAVMPEAYVFPRLLSDPFARGAIVVDCQKKVQIIYEFLGNNNHIVVSSRGRYLPLFNLNYVLTLHLICNLNGILYFTMLIYYTSS